MYSYGSQYAYAGNPASGFLNDSVQQSMGGLVNGQQGQGPLQQQFGNVLSSMAAGINTGASQGVLPWQQGANASNTPRLFGETAKQYDKRLDGMNRLSPAQAAQLMSTAGPTSILPYIGGQNVSRLIFPIAGAWSLYDGVKSMKALSHEARSDVSARFNPSTDVSYDRAVEQMDSANAAWQHLQY
jgi:hypothetical protein